MRYLIFLNNCYFYVLGYYIILSFLYCITSTCSRVSLFMVVSSRKWTHVFHLSLLIRKHSLLWVITIFRLVRISSHFHRHVWIVLTDGKYTKQTCTLHIHNFLCIFCFLLSMVFKKKPKTNMYRNDLVRRGIIKMSFINNFTINWLSH